LTGKTLLPNRLVLLAALLLAACGEGIANNPSPKLLSLTPTSVPAGSPGFVLTANGKGFAPQSTILFNGSAIRTIFQGSGTLTADISSSLIATPGNAIVEIQTPQPGGGTSGQLMFVIAQVQSPIPTITSMSPNTALAGGSGFTLDVFGSNFNVLSQITVNGNNRSTQLVDGTQLETAISGADLVQAGVLSIGVLNPAPGGGSSDILPLAVNNGVPVLTMISPTSAAAGGSNASLTVTGSGFVPQTQVLFNGSPRATTYTSSTSIAATLTQADLGAAQVAQIVAFNPPPGGGVSQQPQIFAINGIVPLITNLNYTGLPELVDYSYNGMQPDNGVGNLSLSGPVISSNGRFVAFASASSNLIENDTNGQPDVFMRDMCFAQTSCTPTTSLVSISGTSGSGVVAGSQGNSDSLEPTMDTTGGFIAFSSHATNLDPNFPTLTGTTRQIFLHSGCAGTTTSTGTSTPCSTSATALVSVAADGVNGANADATQPSISPDGRYVSFVSTATNLVAGVDPGGVAQIYLRDTCLNLTATTVTCTPTTVLISSSDGFTPADASSSQPSTAGSGAYVTYTSAATNLVSGVTPPVPQIYRTATCISGVADCVQVVAMVSSNDGVTPANGASAQSSITNDGRFVAFASTATNLVQTATTGVQQIFVRDTCGTLVSDCTPSTTLVSIANDNVTPGNALSEQPSISSEISTTSDGQFVAFASLATNLVPGITNGFENIFVRNTCEGAAFSTTTACTPGTSLRSISLGGTQANNVSLRPAISGDGHTVAFISPATNIVPNYATGLGDVFLAGTSF
jgi:WD40-like Beta Propeller Repeat